jgi:hypothetical protein
MRRVRLCPAFLRILSPPCGDQMEVALSLHLFVAESEMPLHGINRVGQTAVIRVTRDRQFLQREAMSIGQEAVRLLLQEIRGRPRRPIAETFCKDMIGRDTPRTRGT